MNAGNDRQTETTGLRPRRLNRRIVGCGILTATLLACGAWLVVGCSSDSPTGPTNTVTLQIQTVFADASLAGAAGIAGGSGREPGRIPVVAAVDRVLARITRLSNGEALAEQELAIRGSVASGQLQVEISGQVETDLDIQMYEGSVLTFRGVERLTLVPGSTLSPTVIMEDVPSSGVRGVVENARIAQRISGARVEVIEPGLSTTTNTSGEFEINIVPGVYTLQVSAEGFVPTQLDTITVRDTLMTDVGVVALVPAQATGEIAIVLTWGQIPSDLDSHLSGPVAAGGERFHVYYNDRGTTTAPPWAALDRDVTTGLGPETVTIAQQLPGSYRFSVHNFSNRFSSPNNPSSALSNSGARVRVFKENQEIASIPIPVGEEGTVWRVFEIDDASGDIQILNTFEYISAPGDVM